MEILFENPLIIIILIGVISSLFKNRNKNERQESPAKRVETRKPKSTQNGSDVFQEMKEIFREASHTYQEEIKPVRRLPEQHLPKITEVKVEPVEVQPSISEDIARGQSGSQIPQLGQPKGLKVDESKLAEAVIWSEILGPPRAKKPYMHNRTRGKY